MDSELLHPVRIGPLELEGNLFLAPVAGYSDRAFRSICADWGADFAYTEMVSAEALRRGSRKTEELLVRAPNEKFYAVQIFGGAEDAMAEGAAVVLERTDADCIDINCGCPVPKIVKTGAGSALTRDPDRLGKIVLAVKDSVKRSGKNIPVTVKIRSGWDSNSLSWKEAAAAAIGAGADAITLHPRTRAQGYEGKADWSLLSALVEFADGRIPVFGSGDVFSAEAALAMLRQTGCSGVMFARGAMGNPFIFRQTKDLALTGRFEEIPAAQRIRTGFRELEILIEARGEESACLEMRKRFCSYSKGMAGGAALRLAIVGAKTFSDYKDIFSAIA